MALTKLTENLNIIQSLPDSPTLGADELKRKFDEGSNAIKTYINDILTKEVDALVKTIQDNVAKQLVEDNKKKYYIGKIIMDTKNVNPSTYLGFGVWQLWGKGRVPVGIDTAQTEFNTSEKTGGEKTHKLTVNELPAHDHSFNRTGGTTTTALVDDGNSSTFGSEIKQHSGYNAKTSAMNKTGKDTAHNNLQPYIVCYMWKRVS